MVKNGFLADNPYEQDIYVSPEMESHFRGKQHVQGIISNSRYDSSMHIIADCTVNGKVYRVKNMSFLEQVYWLLVSEV